MEDVFVVANFEKHRQRAKNGNTTAESGQGQPKTNTDTYILFKNYFCMIFRANGKLGITNIATTSTATALG